MPVLSPKVKARLKKSVAAITIAAILTFGKVNQVRAAISPHCHGMKDQVMIAGTAAAVFTAWNPPLGLLFVGVTLHLYIQGRFEGCEM